MAATEKSVHFFAVDFSEENVVGPDESRARKREKFATRKALLLTMVSKVVEMAGILSNSLSAKQRRLRNRSLRIGVVEKRFNPLFSFL